MSKKKSYLDSKLGGLNSKWASQIQSKDENVTPEPLNSEPLNPKL